MATAPENARAMGIDAFTAQVFVRRSYTSSSPTTYSRPLIEPSADSARAVGIGALVAYCPLVPAL